MKARCAQRAFSASTAFLITVLFAPSWLAAAPHNRHARTLLSGRVVQGVPLSGKAITRPLRSHPWTLDLRPHDSPGAAASARIVHFDCPSMANVQSKPRVDGPGDTVRFTATVEWDGQGTPPFGVALHTNANQDQRGDRVDYSMKLVNRQGNTLHYEVELPITRVGNYLAKAVLVKDGRVLKGGADAWSKGNDYAFRPYFREHDRSDEVLVNLANIGPGRFGTFEDMIGDERVPNPRGKYTLKEIHDLGKTVIRFLPFASHVGHPYSKTSYFDVLVDHSAPAMKLRAQIKQLKRTGNADPAQIAQLEAQMYVAAIKSFRAFTDEAHKRGIRVALDYIANHTGPDVRMLDLFFKDAQGRGMDIFDLKKTAASFSIRENDPTQLAIDDDHLNQMVEAINRRGDTGQTISLQKVDPRLYAKYGSRHGARNEHEIADGGFFEWPKPETWQLGHGRQRHGYSWFDLPQSWESERTRGLVKRDLAFWVLMGVDAFRYDHITGMPRVFVEQDLHDVQRVADKYRPGLQLLRNGEDFHTAGYTEKVMDVLERGAFKAITGSQNVEQLRNTYDAAWVQGSPKEVGNHDEGGAIHKFGGNPAALARVLALNKLVGGPSSEKMLDALAERKPMDHRNLTHKPYALFHANDVMRATRDVAARAGWAKKLIPALWERKHHWLKEPSGKDHPQILAMARFRDRNDHQLALVFANNSGARAQQGRFMLTDEAKTRLKENSHYQAYNAMGDWNRPLWSKPMTGKELANAGVYVELQPNETQVLDLRAVQQKSGQWVAEPRDSAGWLTVGYALDFE